MSQPKKGNVRQVIKIPAELKHDLAVEAAKRAMTVSDVIMEALATRLVLITRKGS